jgi:diadenosine tetraphosphate (Ap4A) HIT family hydrolase
VAGCLFCAKVSSVDPSAGANGGAAAFEDGFPVAAGHTLVVPREHVSRLEDLDHASWAEVFTLVHEVVVRLSGTDGVHGVNIGVNSGPAAGQTIDHAHVHVIPRRHGDVADPRGGVRWVIPENADYWSGR